MANACSNVGAMLEWEMMFLEASWAQAYPASTASAIAVVRRDGELGLLALAHLSDSLVPAL